MDRKTSKAMEKQAAKEIYWIESAATIFSIFANASASNLEKAEDTLQGLDVVQDVYAPDKESNLQKSIDEMSWWERQGTKLGLGLAGEHEFEFTPELQYETITDDKGVETEVAIEGSDDPIKITSSKLRAINKIFPYLEGGPEDRREVLKTLINVPSMKEVKKQYKVGFDNPETDVIEGGLTEVETKSGDSKLWDFYQKRQPREYKEGIFSEEGRRATGEFIGKVVKGVRKLGGGASDGWDNPDGSVKDPTKLTQEEQEEIDRQKREESGKNTGSWFNFVK